MKPSSDISRLLEIMRALRDPVSGCPWDQKQDFSSIAPYTIEEAYEVIDAIERGSMADLRDELGDLLLQVVFHAQMAAEQQAFSFDDVVLAITSKMVRRHPHVFGETFAEDAAGAKRSWNEIKARERAARTAGEVATADNSRDQQARSWLADVPAGLPSLTGALKLQQRAAEVGFDWSEAAPILDKIEEEIAELRQALAAGGREEAQGEFGDLLFSLVNLGRHLSLDPEAALRQTNSKFRRRFGYIEARLAAQGTQLHDASLDQMEALWQQAKLPNTAD